VHEVRRRAPERMKPGQREHAQVRAGKKAPLRRARAPVPPVRPLCLESRVSLGRALAIGRDECRFVLIQQVIFESQMLDVKARSACTADIQPCVQSWPVPASSSGAQTMTILVCGCTAGNRHRLC
jgi:hypothetical protein